MAANRQNLEVSLKRLAERTMSRTKWSRLGLLIGATALAGMSSVGCTTLGSRSTAGDSQGDGSQAVVLQVGRKNAVLAPHDRGYYLDLRQAKTLAPKLAGALATGETDAAITLARARLAKAPGDPMALTMLASALALSRHYDLASYYASMLLKAQPDNATALNIKGLAAMLRPKPRMTDYHLAETYFKQALDANPHEIAAGLNLGNLELELGDAASASQVFADSVSRCGRCSPGLLGLGVALARGREFSRAEAAFDAVLAKNPNDAAALYNLALVRKNGYNDKQQAEKYLYALLNGSHTDQDGAIRERAQVVLRMLKGEASPEERTQIADDMPSSDQGSDAANTAGDEQDAKLLMTGVEDEGDN